jgi:hypothetical protein
LPGDSIDHRVAAGEFGAIGVHHHFRGEELGRDDRSGMLTRPHCANDRIDCRALTFAYWAP